MSTDVSITTWSTSDSAIVSVEPINDEALERAADAWAALLISLSETST